MIRTFIKVKNRHNTRHRHGIQECFRILLFSLFSCPTNQSRTDRGRSFSVFCVRDVNSSVQKEFHRSKLEDRKIFAN